jgi:hypothetical protein
MGLLAAICKVTWDKRAIIIILLESWPLSNPSHIYVIEAISATYSHVLEVVPPHMLICP